MLRKLLSFIVCLLIGLFAFSISIDNLSYTQDIYAKSKNKKNYTKHKAKGKIEEFGRIEMSAESLDQAWKNRHLYKKKFVTFGEAKSKVPNNYEIAWRVARAVYYGGWFCLPKNYDSDKKIEYWQYGVDAGELAVELNNKNVEGHYWLAIIYGCYGRTKGILASLSLAPKIRDALTIAIKIDPSYHFAGPYRIRGRLYFLLPWLISFGDNKKALEDLKKAVEIGKNCRLNYVFLAHTQAEEESEEIALKTLELADKLPDIGGKLEEELWKDGIEKIREHISN